MTLNIVPTPLAEAVASRGLEARLGVLLGLELHVVKRAVAKLAVTTSWLVWSTPIPGGRAGYRYNGAHNARGSDLYVTTTSKSWQSGARQQFQRNGSDHVPRHVSFDAEVNRNNATHGYHDAPEVLQNDALVVAPSRSRQAVVIVMKHSDRRMPSESTFDRRSVKAEFHQDIQGHYQNVKQGHEVHHQSGGTVFRNTLSYSDLNGSGNQSNVVDQDQEPSEDEYITSSEGVNSDVDSAPFPTNSGDCMQFVCNRLKPRYNYMETTSDDGEDTQRAGTQQCRSDIRQSTTAAPDLPPCRVIRRGVSRAEGIDARRVTTVDPVTAAANPQDVADPNNNITKVSVAKGKDNEFHHRQHFDNAQDCLLFGQRHGRMTNERGYARPRLSGSVVDSGRRPRQLRSVITVPDRRYSRRRSAHCRSEDDDSFSADSDNDQNHCPTVPITNGRDGKLDRCSRQRSSRWDDTERYEEPKSRHSKDHWHSDSDSNDCHDVPRRHSNGNQDDCRHEDNDYDSKRNSRKSSRGKKRGDEPRESSELRHRGRHQCSGSSSNERRRSVHHRDDNGSSDNEKDSSDDNEPPHRRRSSNSGRTRHRRKRQPSSSPDSDLDANRGRPRRKRHDTSDRKASPQGQGSRSQTRKSHHHVKPEKFDGRGCVDTFLEKNNLCATYNDWTSSEKLTHLRLSLVDGAAALLQRTNLNLSISTT